jgi:thiol-disulfide isomerase/thioredoxin
MTARLILALALAGLGWLSYMGLSRLVLAWRTRRGLGVEAYQSGRPAVLYFTAPGCAPCHTMQRPELDRLAAEFGPRLQIIELDATQRPDMADHWGVLSVPTTFVIDAQGRPRGVNHGVARAERLAAQLAAVGEAPSTPPALHGEATAGQ